ncbi:WD repeat, SAM and U-box domain-containing protein 1-like [Mya arenaria]|uniref:WD repeat, SAM and U-box domain-containing protein 1-like n=1 Tax=Mya arenaria TaxID=6604 RepID=UPI0022E20F2F|nr:WD repeat, SAM and U-box domain-containing protein 1-like [Mya arenaria]
MSEKSVLASLVHTISSHTSDVNGVCFSKSGKLATCSADKTVRVWDTEDYSELPCSPLCGHTYYVHCCTFSPFGTQLASCSTDGKVIIWDLKTGEKKCIFQHESKAPIRVCKFSPNSSMLLSGGDDNNLCLWNLSTESLIVTYKGHEGTVFGLDFTPDGHYIVSGSSDGDLQVWDAMFGHAKALLLELEGHDLGVMCCDFSPTYGTAGCGETSSGMTNFLLATCGMDDLVKLWEFKAFAGDTRVLLTEKIVFKGHEGSVMVCNFSLNGKILASGSSDKTVRLWDPIQGVPLHVIEGHTRYVISVAFSSDGQYLASGSNDKSVMIWKLQSEQQIFTALENGEPVCAESPHQRAGQKVTVTVNLQEMSVDDVAQWISEIGLQQYCDTFRKQDIDGQELSTLTQECLKNALGIDSLGHRNKILRSRAQLLECPIMQQKTVQDEGIPDEYLCPITREIMKDPVICSDGYSYERSAITNWMRNDKDRSPMTNSVLVNKELTPNRSLRTLIQRYLNP